MTETPALAILGQVVDSHLNCPRDGKRMLLELGQEDVVESRIGALAAVHVCPHCDYREADSAWVKPTRRARELVAARLMAQRLAGWTHDIVYDTEPFPRSEFDEEPADA